MRDKRAERAKKAQEREAFLRRRRGEEPSVPADDERPPGQKFAGHFIFHKRDKGKALRSSFGSDWDDAIMSRDAAREILLGAVGEDGTPRRGYLPPDLKAETDSRTVSLHCYITPLEVFECQCEGCDGSSEPADGLCFGPGDGTRYPAKKAAE